MAVKLEIYMTNNYGTSGKATIDYINPEATTEKLKTMAQKFVGLTSNVYIKSVKVETTNCDTSNGE